MKRDSVAIWPVVRLGAVVFVFGLYFGLLAVVFVLGLFAKEMSGQQNQRLALARVLTIAGSDSGGGAGIQADLKTFTAHGVYGSSVLTVITAQNTLGIHGVHALSPEFVAQQLDVVLSDIGTDTIKIGALSNAGTIRAVTATLRKHFPEMKPTYYWLSLRKLVLDPVMVASSGDKLLQRDAVRTLIDELFPLTFILTPNIPEAEALLEELRAESDSKNTTKPFKIKSLIDMKKVAAELALEGPSIVLLKGGHLPFRKDNGQAAGADDLSGDIDLELVDVVFDSRGDKGMFTEVRRDFVRSRSTHGTGCTLSAAIAANLALGHEAAVAIEKAIDYVQGGIRHAEPIGGGIGTGTRQGPQGHGPLNHTHSILHRAIELPTTSNSHPFTSHLLRKYAKEWKAYTHHPFVQALRNGSLPRENFIYYIKQDYLFLQNYARAHGLAAYKSRTLAESGAYAKIVVSIAHETQMHVEFCAKWGVTYEELLSTQESMANVAYTRYVLDVGMNGDLLDLCVAVAPCLVGYGHIGQRLFNDPSTMRGAGNSYWEWITIYAGEDYQNAVRQGIERLEEMVRAQNITEPRLAQLEKIFVDATNLETAFWEMALQPIVVSK